MPSRQALVDPNRTQRSAKLWNVSLLSAAVAMDIGLGLSILATSLLAIALGATPWQIGLVGVIWRIPYVIFCPLSGHLSDRIGRKRIAQAAALLLAALHFLLIRVDTLSQLFWVVPFIGLTTGTFWPPIQSWIGDIRTGELGTAVGKFNIAWSSASLLGTLLAGFLAEVSVTTPLLLAGIIIGLISLIIAIVPDRAAQTASSPGSAGTSSAPPGHRAFLFSGWIANFVAFVGAGAITTFFPKLGADLGLSSGLIGLITSIFVLGRVLMFAVLTTTRRWQYHTRLLPVALIASALSMLLVSLSNHLVLIAFFFIVMGAVTAVTYTASLFYGLDAPQQSGANAGVHEALLSGGVAFSALLGGLVAQNWGMKAPFILSATMLLLGAASIGFLMTSQQTAN